MKERDEFSSLTTLDPSIMDLNPTLGGSGLRADLLVFRIDGHSDTEKDVAITCPTAPPFLKDAQVCFNKAAHTRFQQKCQKDTQAIRAESSKKEKKRHSS